MMSMMMHGGGMYNRGYYNDYYYNNRCYGGCPYNAHCEWGFCEVTSYFCFRSPHNIHFCPVQPGV